MKDNEKIFLSNNPFTTWGGGTLRMKAFVNTLSDNNSSVTFISNADDISIFDKKINHLKMPVFFTPIDKRIIQLCIALFPLFVLDIVLYSKLKKLRNFFQDNEFGNKRIIFFEYLDNSLGYYLKKRGCINEVCNDLHGIALNEFQSKESRGYLWDTYNRARYNIAVKLDKKVFDNATSVIYASEYMRKYYLEEYPFLENHHYYIIPYALDDKVFNQTVNNKLYQSLMKKYNIKSEDNVIFYAGAFKEIGGILDLIDAFKIITKEVSNIKLFILGKGNVQNRIDEKIDKYGLKDNIILAGTIPYEELRTYQQLADVVVCPDRQNLYNNMIFPLKYPDSLLSRKPVIYGSFKTVIELNKNESLSINFKPSDIGDLAKKIKYVLTKKELLKNKYKNNSSKLSFFRYSSYLNILQKL